MGRSAVGVADYFYRGARLSEVAGTIGSPVPAHGPTALATSTFGPLIRDLIAIAFGPPR